ncbi:sigma-70 family RNA polymerase sigma factor [Sutcliffiella horikoshii]|uniref:sigma-70 family RNA polymerase sigma factor n=1 Tax=Sutcliffiella horikoshii TaxID=79883 RepID=UPI00384FBF3F
MDISAQENWRTNMSKDELFENLVDEYGTELKRIAFLYVRDLTLAEDIIQEVYISCYKNLDNFRNESSYKTWLIRITINKSKDALKGWHFRNFISKPQIELEQGEIITPESSLLSQAEDKALFQELLKLPLKYREVLILHYYKDFSLEEISTLTDINSKTVKTRLFRARQKLKERLERSGDQWKRD